MIYKIFRAFFFSIFKIFNWFQIKNQEQLPTDGPVIVACNHISNWDPMVLGSAVPRIVNFVAKIELFKTPVVGFFMKVWGAIPIKRGRGDREAITRSLEVLESGRVLGIFIEGRRNKGKPDQMLPPQVGVAMLALKAALPWSRQRSSIPEELSGVLGVCRSGSVSRCGLKSRPELIRRSCIRRLVRRSPERFKSC